METVIREGALRLLTTESSCDVILSCQGHRLMAHRVILSMASPIFKDLLKEATSDPTVIIFPDVSSNTMSLVLDYIYTGSVVVYSNTIQDLLCLASILEIHLELGKDHVFKRCDKKFLEKKEDIVSSSDMEVYSRRNQKRLPKLMPISRFQPQEKMKSKKRLCSYVSPSPWCPRVEGVFDDPRNVGTDWESQVSPPGHQNKPQEYDPNNNFQHMPKTFNQNSQSTYNPNSKSYPLEGDSSYAKYQLESYKIRNIYNGSLNSTISKPPDDLSWSRSSKNKRLVLEGIRTQESEVQNVVDSYSKQVISDTVSPRSTNAVDVEEQKEEITVSSHENCSSSNDGEGESNDSRAGVERKYDKKKPFKCEECGKSFSQLRNYKYHRRYVMVPVLDTQLLDSITDS
ncbi:hypothetical protein JTB14_022710 [Gonioctena quinquepunctata]|nr:hypothetical protein JTB14_022710 [Gonioctena quinquepunctata]